ncbi:unnamed protein product [Prunus armeniaca]|uniref:Uncharacterized protein n=1 Tax=Prunus armeniaca TaxID=36596 RepID=A0A6J5XUG2_PRUAR|nr:hypothetical protein GBA52_019643 [Prunus armeniaca]CAB4314644.1 unnamed protein product [Prunus armeniaca]
MYYRLSTLKRRRFSPLSLLRQAHPESPPPGHRHLQHHHQIPGPPTSPPSTTSYAASQTRVASQETREDKACRFISWQKRPTDQGCRRACGTGRRLLRRLTRTTVRPYGSRRKAVVNLMKKNMFNSTKNLRRQKTWLVQNRR